MGVFYFIADDLTEDPVGVKCFLLGAGYFCGDFEVRPNIRNIPNPAIVLLWDDLDMARGLRMDVEKGHEVGVFIDYLRGNFLVDYFAEDAVFHECIIVEIWANKNSCQQERAGIGSTKIRIASSNLLAGRNVRR